MTRPNPIRLITMTALAALALPTAAASAQDEMVQVDLRTVDGGEAGTATFKQMRHGVVVTLNLKNLTPGPHGFHIHETGACTPDFKAAGSHYDPIDAEHGFGSEGGYHVGDLPNIHVAADGTVRGDVFVQQVALTRRDNGRYPFSLRDEDGSALMVHAQGDDYKDMDSSGSREACGVIAPPRG